MNCCLELVTAAGRGNIEGVSRLLQNGLDPNCTSAGGITPLMATVGCLDLYEDRRRPSRKFDPEVDQLLRIILEAGADVNFNSSEWPIEGYTALIFACMHYPLNISRLLDAGANVNLPSKDGLTPLMAAAHNRHAVLLLLKAGADATSRDQSGRNALHYAQTASVGKLLKKAGANIHDADINGMTPLLYCAQRGYLSLVTWLWSDRRTRDARTKIDQTAKDLSREARHLHITEWLLDHKS